MPVRRGSWCSQTTSRKACTRSKKALAIKEVADQFAGGQVLSVWCDPAASARTGIGPSAMSEIVRIFGDRHVARSPQAPILDGMDMIEFILDHEDLLIHP